MAEFPPTLGLTNRRDLPDADRLFWVATAFVGFATLFTLTWAVSRVWAPVSHTFNKFDFKGRCDWASRVPSVVHANLVLWFLWHENLFSVTWNEWFQTADDLSVLERNMCISAGYFLYDFIIIVWSKMEWVPQSGPGVEHRADSYVNYHVEICGVDITGSIQVKAELIGPVRCACATARRPKTRRLTTRASPTGSCSRRWMRRPRLRPSLQRARHEAGSSRVARRGGG